jgi:hypothetical protein
VNTIGCPASGVATGAIPYHLLINATQHLFVPVNLHLRMQTALHQRACPAEFDRLSNLVVDRAEVENAAFPRRRSFQRTIERAEGAILGAEVCVVNVAVDDVGAE